MKGLGYYKLHNEGRTWNEAKAICEREGAHLAIINSKEEVQLFVEMRNRLPKLLGDWKDDTFNIGVNDIETDGRWVTIFGKRFQYLVKILSKCSQFLSLTFNNIAGK